MKKAHSITYSILTIFLLSITHAHAAYISSNDTGQAIIVPYYTVNNNLNTLGTIINTTDQIKAIKLRFLEGKNALNVMSLNIYLAPNDEWVFALTATSSDIIGHQNEESIFIISTDNSCVVTQNQDYHQILKQEFSATVLDKEYPDNSMIRAREGMIQIIEMGEVSAESQLGQSIMFEGGYPKDCEAINESWKFGGLWKTNPVNSMLPSTGGIKARVSLIDVGEGAQYSISTTAIDEFHAEGTVLHTGPFELSSPSLNDAYPVSNIFNKGETIKSYWEHGYEAISALFMKSAIINEYDLQVGLNGLSELIVTFPTKHFYTNGINPLKPFTRNYGINSGSCLFTQSEPETGYPGVPLVVYDRESIKIDNYWGACITTPPTGFCQVPTVGLCSVTNSISFKSPGIESGSVFSSNNAQDFELPSRSVGNFENGHIKLVLNFYGDEESNPADGEMVSYYTGLPVLGFMAQKYTNAGAAEGLLAQYGTTQDHSYEVEVFSDIQDSGKFD